MNPQGLRDIKDRDRPKAAILGSRVHVFPRMLADAIRQRGMEPVFVVPKGDDRQLEDGSRVLSAAKRISEQSRLRFMKWRSWIEWFERNVVFPLGRARLERFQAEFGGETANCSIGKVVEENFMLAEAVQNLMPRFVFANQVFNFGLAAVRCHGFPRIVMPWGGDIYNYAEGSALSFRLVRYALKNADLVLPTSKSSVRHICSRFGVEQGKVKAISWGVDLRLFEPASEKERKEILERNAISPAATIIFNSRRFKPAWGCEAATLAGIQIAKECAAVHFIMIGGDGNDRFVEDSETRTRAAGVGDRFSFIRGEIPLEQFAELARVADIVLSLKLSRDMRALSILQPAYAGAYPILSDQPEYRVMEREGMRARFVNPEKVEDITEAIREAIEDTGARREAAEANRRYIAENEDQERQMEELMDVIFGVCRDFGR